MSSNLDKLKELVELKKNKGKQSSKQKPQKAMGSVYGNTKKGGKITKKGGNFDK